MPLGDQADSGTYTPQSMRARSRVAEALIRQGLDTSPIGSHYQGLNRVLQSMMGNYQLGQLAQTEREALRAGDNALSGFGGGMGDQSPPTPGTQPPPGQNRVVSALSSATDPYGVEPPASHLAPNTNATDPYGVEPPIQPLAPNAPQQQPPPPTAPPPSGRMGVGRSVYEFFVRAGYPPHQAAAIAGNMAWEGGGRTDLVNPGDNARNSPDSPHSAGIAQWNDRLPNLIAMARGMGIDIPEGNLRDPRYVQDVIRRIPLEMQLEFAHAEMGTSEETAGRNIQGATNLQDAAAGAIGYHRPAGWTASNPTAGHGFGGRLSLAQQILQANQGNATPPPAGNAQPPPAAGGGLMADPSAQPPPPTGGAATQPPPQGGTTTPPPGQSGSRMSPADLARARALMADPRPQVQALGRAMFAAAITPPPLTEAQREFEQYRRERIAAGLPHDDWDTYRTRHRQASALTNNVDLRGEGREAVLGAEARNATRTAMQQARTTARSQLGNITLLRSLMDQPGFYSGAGGNIALSAQQIISQITGNTSGAASMEAFASQSNQMVMSTLGTLGANISNSDRDFITNMFPNINTTEAGNRTRLEIMERLARRQIEAANFMDQHRAQNNGRMSDNFEAELDRWREQNPIFSQADLERIRAQGSRSGGQGSPPPTTTPPDTVPPTGPRRIRRFNAETGQLE